AISRKTTKSSPATPALVATQTPVATNETAPVAAPVEQKVVEQQVAAPVEQRTETPAAQNVAAPVEQTIETPAPVAPKVALVDVRIDSTPSGAEVTLVDHGKSMFLGSTPISASVDPSKTYEVMLSYPNKPSKMEKLDPKTTTHLAVSFGKGAAIVETAKPAAVAPAPVAKIAAPAVVPAAVVAPKAVPQRQKVEAVAPKTEVAADKPVKAEKTEPKAEKTEAKAEPKADKTEAAASEGGEGVLMLGSKPPCEIFVDGKDTGLMTPQRAMKLSVGKHSIRLASPDGEHNKTLSVDIKPDKPTKVIEDLLGL
ncbi:MAG TPA: PEGA domain-containing protein, partial [Kofleriaceae bacterium]